MFWHQVQYLAAIQDRYRAFIDRSVRKVPEDKRIQPAPQIAGPVLEGIRYEPEGTEIDEMFSNLLAHAMDQDNVGRAHPAYANLIKQLSRDEAVCLAEMFTETHVRIHEADLDTMSDPRGEPKFVFINQHTISDTFPVGRLYSPERLNFYLNHLNSLGLAGLYKVDEVPLREDPAARVSRQTGTRVTSHYRLTDVGWDFMTACRPPA